MHHNGINCSTNQQFAVCSHQTVIALSKADKHNRLKFLFKLPLSYLALFCRLSCSSVCTLVSLPLKVKLVSLLCKYRGDLKSKHFAWLHCKSGRVFSWLKFKESKNCSPIDSLSISSNGMGKLTTHFLVWNFWYNTQEWGWPLLI